SDAVAASRRPNHLEERDQIVRAEIAAGWVPLFLRPAPADPLPQPASAAPPPPTEVLPSRGDAPAALAPPELADLIPASAGQRVLNLDDLAAEAVETFDAPVTSV